MVCVNVCVCVCVCEGRGLTTDRFNSSLTEREDQTSLIAVLHPRHSEAERERRDGNEAEFSNEFVSVDELSERRPAERLIPDSL